MIVTGAFLAESASAVDNKLQVQGGVVDKFVADSRRIVPVTLVVLIQPQLFDKAPLINVTISTPSGELQQVVLEVPESSLGGNVGFLCAPLRISAPTDGSYSLAVSAQTGAVTLPLNVTS